MSQQKSSGEMLAVVYSIGDGSMFSAPGCNVFILSPATVPAHQILGLAPSSVVSNVKVLRNPGSLPEELGTNVSIQKSHFTVQ